MAEYQYYEPEALPEDDDILAADVLDELGEDTSIYSWLKEDISAEELNSLVPTQIVIGLIPNEHTYDKEAPKRRPFVFLFRAPDADAVIAFPITSSDILPISRYALKNWADCGLRKPSFVNIDHTVIIRKDQIQYIKYRNLSEEDTKGLISKMRTFAEYLKSSGKTHWKYDVNAEADHLEQILLR